MALPIRLIIRVVLPFALGLSYYSACLLLLPGEKAMILGGLMVAYIIPPAGKETVIPLGVALGIPWWLIAVSVALLDVLAGIFMALNFDLAFRIPLLGAWISRFMDHGQVFLAKRPWLKKFYFTGVVLFVMFPLQGSGGVGASLVGRLLGMSRGAVLLAITIGAFLGCFLIALGAEFIWTLILSRPLPGIMVAVAVVTALAAGYIAYRWRMSTKT